MAATERRPTVRGGSIASPAHAPYTWGLDSWGYAIMHAEERIIHFSTELIHGPAPRKKEALQRLYFDLSQTRGAGYDSTDFTDPNQARFYSRRGKTQSIALFLPDRAVLIEEWADSTLSDFVDKVGEVAPRILGCLGAPRYLAHTVTIRATFALTHFSDARVFLLDHVCKQENKIGPHFGRPIATGGLRFVLPESNEHNGNLNVIIESFRHSRNEVFVEAKGVFGRQPVDAESVSVILDNARAVRAFISERVYPYLEQFDHPKDLFT